MTGEKGFVNMGLLPWAICVVWAWVAVILVYSFNSQFFFLFFIPGYARQTRHLLFTETDQFGNVVDPNTGKIITVAGGHTPFPLPPWLDQTPAILQWMNSTRLTDTARRIFSQTLPEQGAEVTPQENQQL